MCSRGVREGQARLPELPHSGAAAGHSLDYSQPHLFFFLFPLTKLFSHLLLCVLATCVFGRHLDGISEPYDACKKGFLFWGTKEINLSAAEEKWEKLCVEINKVRLLRF